MHRQLLFLSLVIGLLLPALPVLLLAVQLSLARFAVLRRFPYLYRPRLLACRGIVKGFFLSSSTEYSSCKVLGFMCLPMILPIVGLYITLPPSVCGHSAIKFVKALD